MAVVNITYIETFFFIGFNSMPHYRVILHVLHNLSFSFTISVLTYSMVQSPS